MFSYFACELHERLTSYSINIFHRTDNDLVLNRCFYSGSLSAYVRHCVLLDCWSIHSNGGGGGGDDRVRQFGRQHQYLCGWGRERERKRRNVISKKKLNIQMAIFFASHCRFPGGKTYFWFIESNSGWFMIDQIEQTDDWWLTNLWNKSHVLVLK